MDSPFHSIAVDDRDSNSATPTKRTEISEWLAKNGLPLNNNSETEASEAPSLQASPVLLTPKATSNRKKAIAVGTIIFLIIAAAVAVPLILTHFLRKKPTSDHAARPDIPTDGDGPKDGGTKDDGFPASGTNGSLVRMDNGTTFTYVNNFGGDWAFDPKDPFAPGGKAQNWGKRIGKEEWVWGSDIIRGVNLGGWLVTEPFIVPALFEKYGRLSNTPVVDEWSLCLAMGSDLAQEMENHYATFITEKDFAEIAGAGLNWVRIPIGYWAIETKDDEPFLPHVSWTYFLKAVQWARKYGLRIYLDFHALPGSQNGWNHSGKVGKINFMLGVMGIANAQRSLTYIRTFVEFISQDQYKDVIGIFGVLNEIAWTEIGKPSIESFYYKSYETIRSVTGNGAGKGPYIAIHEGFQGVKVWEGFLSGSDRLMIDQHPYLAFWRDHSFTIDQLAQKPCNWAMETNTSSSQFGVTISGECATAINDCGLWVNGVGVKPTFPGDCSVWDNWDSYDQATIASLKKVTLATMDALQNFFYWTWKIGDSIVLGKSSSPLWHYKLGLERGWIPKDPREAIGYCAGVLGSSNVFQKYPATATGGAGAGSLASTIAFPPASLAPAINGAQMSVLPTYTPTGTIKPLSPPTFTAAPSADTGSGWANADDKTGAYVPVQGCNYPNAWDAVNAPLPNAPCTGN